jgi:hypothetical protein
MPVTMKTDPNGHYFQWGEHGTKYYFDENDDEAKRNAEDKARRQGRAAYARGYREPTDQ